MSPQPTGALFSFLLLVHGVVALAVANSAPLVVTLPLVVAGAALATWAAQLYAARRYQPRETAQCVRISELQQRLLTVESARVLHQEAEANAIQASRAKSAFLATISHEIRTPLNTIVGYSELMDESNQGNSVFQSDLERIRSSASHALALLDDVQDVAQIETGTLSLELESFDVSRLVSSCVDLFTSRVASKQLSLFNDVAPKQLLMADPNRTRQVLLNLLGHALHSTEFGGIHVCAQARGSHLALNISDTGVGLSEAQLEALFDRSGANQTIDLGLVIARDLAERMGGELTVRSEVGRGTTFTLVLPRVATQRPTSSTSRRISIH